MGTKKINPDIKASPDIEEAMANFKPRFGSVEDINIVNTWGEIKNTLTLMAGDDARRLEMKRITKNNSKRMEEIRRKEKNLLYQLQNRKV